jgi:trigger factor
MNKNTVMDLLKNKKVWVGGVSLLSIGVLAMYLLQKPQELSQINEIKATQNKESPEKIEDNKKDAFDNSATAANDGVEIVQGDYDISKAIEIPDVSSLIGQANNYQPNRDDALLQARLSKTGREVEDSNARAQLGDTIIVTVTAKEGDKFLDGFSIRGNRVTIGAKLIDRLLEEQIKGMKPTEEKVVDITYPADYDNPLFAGKTINFTIISSKLVRPDEPSKEEVDKIYQAMLDNANYSNQFNKIKEIKLQIKEKAKVNFYPAKVISKLEEEYKKFFLGVKYKDEDEFFQKTGSSKSDYLAGRSEYVLERIKDELILEALSKKTGITMDSEEFKKVSSEYFNEDQKRNLLYELNIQKLMK